MIMHGSGRMGMSTRWTGVLSAVLALVMLGCASGPRLTGPLPAAPPSDRLTLSPGDELGIKFQYTPELDEEQTIRPDGKISLPIVDEVQAAGLTPAELDASLTERYQDKLRDPVITVIVRSLANQLVYVGGEVKTPGAVEIHGEMTVLEAVLAAGGSLNMSANLKNVVIIRHNEGRRYATAIDLTQRIEVAESEPFYLAPRDIVYVSRTPIDKVDQWVDQHINKMIPRTDVFYTYFVSSK